MVPAAINPYKQAKQWILQYRAHGKVYVKGSEYSPKEPLVGLEQAVNHLKSAICQQSATQEKLTHLCWYLRNAAAQNGNDKLLARIHFFSVCLAKGLNSTRLLDCELEGDSLCLSSVCFPLEDDFIQLLKELGRPIRIQNSSEVFHPSVFQGIASTLKTQEAYYPKKSDWQHKKVIASEALLLACHQLLTNAQGTLNDDQVVQLSLQADRLAEATHCLELTPWLTHMRLCLSKGIMDPFLLSLPQQTVILIQADQFPLSETIIKNVRLLGYSVRVINSREVFAAPVFVQLANQFKNFEDFQEREHDWCSFSFKASRALLSLAEGLSGLTHMQGQATQEADDANLEELQITLRYLATREESLIEDVARFYLFANKYMIAPLQEACVTKLVHLAHHDAPQVWPLAHYLSTVDAPKDAFTQVMGKGTVLKQSDFPLSPAFIQEVGKMDVAFIAVEDDEAIFSKQAFLKICQFETNLAFLDFCLMSCSLYGENFSVAPLISRLAGNLKAGSSCKEKDFPKIYQKLVDYLYTLDASRLVDLVVAAGTPDIGAVCPQATSGLARALECEANATALKMRIKKEVIDWLQTEDPSISFAQKLNRLIHTEIKTDDFTYFNIHTADLDASFSWSASGWSIHTNKSTTSRGFAMLEGLSIRHFYCLGHIEADIFKRIVTPNLKHLYLIDENVSIEIIQHVAKFSLKTLTIHSVSMTDEWFEYINQTVRDLRIIEANMTGSGLKRIQHLPLKILHLDYIESFEESHLVNLRGMPLRCFSVLGTKGVTKVKSKYLKSARLKIARFEYSGIGDETIRVLKGMPIEEIDLSKTKITDQALEEVMANMPLSQVNLQNTKVTDKGVSFLQSKKLKKLYLDETEVTEPLRQVFRSKGTKTYLNSQHDKGPEPQPNRRESELRLKTMNRQGDDEDCPCWVSVALLTAATVVGGLVFKRLNV